MGGLIWIIVMIVVIKEIRKLQGKSGQRVKPNVPRQQQNVRPNQMAGQQNVRPNQMTVRQNVRPNQIPRQQGERRVCVRIRGRDGRRRVQAGLPWRAAADRSSIRRRMTY